MNVGKFFEKSKKISVDLSNMIGVSNLLNEYDVIETPTFTNFTTLTSDNVGYDLAYFNIDEDELEGLLMQADNEVLYMKLVHSSELFDEEKFDEAISNIEENKIGFTNVAEHSVEFNSITDVERGSEYVKHCIDESFEGDAFESVWRLFSNDNEYLFIAIADGELNIYAGILLTEGRIL